MDKAFILAALNHGAMQLEGQFVYGSNYTFMVQVNYQAQTFKAVYKPVRGERPLWDFPDQTLAYREVAAFLLSEALGWELVPPTVYRAQESPVGPGSAQLFIDHDPDYHYFVFEEKDKQLIPRVVLFDLLINNADRKSGHLLVDSEGLLWSIDHGLCFHVEDKLRTVLWEHAGEVIPSDLLVDVEETLARLNPGQPLYDSLKPYLLSEEIAVVVQRGQNLMAKGVFPNPPEDRRAYPWPLI